MTGTATSVPVCNWKNDQRAPGAGAPELCGYVIGMLTKLVRYIQEQIYLICNWEVVSLRSGRGGLARHGLGPLVFLRRPPWPGYVLNLCRSVWIAAGMSTSWF